MVSLLATSPRTEAEIAILERGGTKVYDYQRETVNIALLDASIYHYCSKQNIKRRTHGSTVCVHTCCSPWPTGQVEETKETSPTTIYHYKTPFRSLSCFRCFGDDDDDDNGHTIKKCFLIN